MSCPCWPTTSIPLGRGLTIVGANVSDGSGTATVSGDEIVYQPSAGYFGATTFTYTIEDARRTQAGQAVGTVARHRHRAARYVRRHRRPPPTTPRPPSRGQLPPANGSPLTDVELQPEGLAPIVARGHQQPHAHRARQRACRTASRCAPRTRPAGASGAPGPRPSPPTRSRAACRTPTVAFGDGQLTVNWQAPPNEGSALTGYEIEIGGGLNAVIARGTATTYVWDGLTNGANYQFRVVATNAAGAPTRRRGRSPSTRFASPTHRACRTSSAATASST